MERWDNKCVSRGQGGFCIKCQCNCPSILKCDKDNNNNAPCDLVSYVPFDLKLSCKYFDIQTKECSKNLDTSDCENCIKFRTF